MSNNLNGLVFSGDGIRLVLFREGGGIVLEVTLDPSDYPQCGHVALEVLLQPRAANGLPEGMPQTLYATTITLSRAGQLLRGHCWLPASLSEKLVSKCHFRVQPVGNPTGNDDVSLSE